MQRPQSLPEDTTTSIMAPRPLLDRSNVLHYFSSGYHPFLNSFGQVKECVYGEKQPPTATMITTAAETQHALSPPQLITLNSECDIMMERCVGSVIKLPKNEQLISFQNKKIVEQRDVVESTFKRLERTAFCSNSDDTTPDRNVNERGNGNITQTCDAQAKTPPLIDDNMNDTTLINAKTLINEKTKQSLCNDLYGELFNIKLLHEYLLSEIISTPLPSLTGNDPKQTLSRHRAHKWTLFCFKLLLTYWKGHKAQSKLVWHLPISSIFINTNSTQYCSHSALNEAIQGNININTSPENLSFVFLKLTLIDVLFHTITTPLICPIAMKYSILEVIFPSHNTMSHGLTWDKWYKERFQSNGLLRELGQPGNQSLADITKSIPKDKNGRNETSVIKKTNQQRLKPNLKVGAVQSLPPTTNSTSHLGSLNYDPLTRLYTTIVSIDPNWPCDDENHESERQLVLLSIINEVQFVLNLRTILTPVIQLPLHDYSKVLCLLTLLLRFSTTIKVVEGDYKQHCHDSTDDQSTPVTTKPSQAHLNTTTNHAITQLSFDLLVLTYLNNIAKHGSLDAPPLPPLNQSTTTRSNTVPMGLKHRTMSGSERGNHSKFKYPERNRLQTQITTDYLLFAIFTTPLPASLHKLFIPVGLINAINHPVTLPLNFSPGGGESGVGPDLDPIKSTRGRQCETNQSQFKPLSSPHSHSHAQNIDKIQSLNLSHKDPNTNCHNNDILLSILQSLHNLNAQSIPAPSQFSHWQHTNSKFAHLYPIYRRYDEFIASVGAVQGYHDHLMGKINTIFGVPGVLIRGNRLLTAINGGYFHYNNATPPSLVDENVGVGQFQYGYGACSQSSWEHHSSSSAPSPSTTSITPLTTTNSSPFRLSAPHPLEMRFATSQYVKLKKELMGKGEEEGEEGGDDDDDDNDDDDESVSSGKNHSIHEVKALRKKNTQLCAPTLMVKTHPMIYLGRFELLLSSYSLVSQPVGTPSSQVKGKRFQGSQNHSTPASVDANNNHNIVSKASQQQQPLDVNAGAMLKSGSKSASPPSVSNRLSAPIQQQLTPMGSSVQHQQPPEVIDKEITTQRLLMHRMMMECEWAAVVLNLFLHSNLFGLLLTIFKFKVRKQKQQQWQQNPINPDNQRQHNSTNQSPISQITLLLLQWFDTLGQVHRRFVQRLSTQGSAKNGPPLALTQKMVSPQSILSILPNPQLLFIQAMTQFHPQFIRAYITALTPDLTLVEWNHIIGFLHEVLNTIDFIQDPRVRLGLQVGIFRNIKISTLSRCVQSISRQQQYQQNLMTRGLPLTHVGLLSSLDDLVDGLLDQKDPTNSLSGSGIVDSGTNQQQQQSGGKPVNNPKGANKNNNQTESTKSTVLEDRIDATIIIQFLSNCVFIAIELQDHFPGWDIED